MANEDYGEIFSSFTDIFDSGGEFVNDVILPQSAGLGGAFFVMLAIILIIAIAIVAFKAGGARFGGKRY